MRILIVDDEFSTRMIVKEIMQRYGECDICVDGDEAVEAFAMALDKKTPYDLVFMDVLMPRMGGIEALEHIRSLEAKQGLLPRDLAKIVVLSVVDEVKTVMDAFKKGEVTAYLTKPLDMDKLIDTIQALGVK